jgi:protein-ribulosamine 3-kinase
MILNSRIKNKIESKLDEKIVSVNSVSGGCINDARIVLTESQKKYFIKINLHHAEDMFPKEANGLNEIRNSKAIRVPIVHYVDNDLIILEAINGSSQLKNFFEEFGRQFALMHKHFGKHFGFFEDNYIGSTVQLNKPDVEEMNDWTKFYFNKRLKFQFKLAEKNGYASEDLRKSFEKLEDKIELILQAGQEQPSLLHGDLWGGNYMIDENGDPCLIDPAAYYGNREADLAMTKLFGGFNNSFHKAYNEYFPLQPGYEFRENIYKLYHVLNHLNLFGMGYYGQALELIKYYL